jgi:hypothetical protein
MDQYHQTYLVPTGVGGCGATNQCGAAFGTPYGPYGLSQTPAAPAAVTPPTKPGLLASLPSWWPYATLGLGGVMAITGIILMATKK